MISSERRRLTVSMTLGYARGTRRSDEHAKTSRMRPAGARCRRLGRRSGPDHGPRREGNLHSLKSLPLGRIRSGCDARLVRSDRVLLRPVLHRLWRWPLVDAVNIVRAGPETLDAPRRPVVLAYAEELSVERQGSLRISDGEADVREPVGLDHRVASRLTRRRPARARGSGHRGSPAFDSSYTRALSRRRPKASESPGSRFRVSVTSPARRSAPWPLARRAAPRMSQVVGPQP